MKLTLATLLAASFFAGGIGVYFDDLKAMTQILAPINNALTRTPR